jgi:hypothetical protein
MLPVVEGEGPAPLCDVTTIEGDFLEDVRRQVPENPARHLEKDRERCLTSTPPPGGSVWGNYHHQRLMDILVLNSCAASASAWAGIGFCSRLLS